MTFKVVVAGGRDFNDFPLMERELDYLLQNHTNVTIVSGRAKGADSLGETYAYRRGFNLIAIPADWETYGKSAGYRRNVEMANKADAVVVFWDGVSRGSKHMIDIANEKGLPLRVIRY